jgi:cytochrome c oxidase accessory protein FixG
MIAAFSLFFFTAVAGRLFCGWACPQTVWTLCYVWLEKLVEGDRNQRMRLDRGPWTATRVR